MPDIQAFTPCRGFDQDHISAGEGEPKSIRVNAGQTEKGKGRMAMSIDRAVMAFAGIMVLASLVLSQVHSSFWLLLTAFVGLNLLQASFTGLCPAAMIFRKLGLKSASAF